MKCIITREQSATVKYAHRHPPPHSLSVQKSKYESTATQYATQLHTKATPDRALLTSAACAFATLTVMWGSAVMGRKPLLSLCLLGAAACVVCRAPSPTLGHRPRQPCLFGKSGSIPRRSGPAVWTPAQSNDHNCGGRTAHYSAFQELPQPLRPRPPSLPLGCRCCGTCSRWCRRCSPPSPSASSSPLW